MRARTHTRSRLRPRVFLGPGASPWPHTPVTKLVPVDDGVGAGFWGAACMWFSPTEPRAFGLHQAPCRTPGPGTSSLLSTCTRLFVLRS